MSFANVHSNMLWLDFLIHHAVDNLLLPFIVKGRQGTQEVGWLGIDWRKV